MGLIGCFETMVEIAITHRIITKKNAVFTEVDGVHSHMCATVYLKVWMNLSIW